MGERTQVPVCVDLDGTLVRSDLLVESLVKLLRTRASSVFRVPLWLARGKVRFKEALAASVEIDASSLPYNEPLLEHLRRERDAGRSLLLVTASHATPARAVADHLDLFDEVIATDGDVNLKGKRKAAELVKRFGEKGFDYAGNSTADLAVWAAAREVIVVDAPARVVKQLGSRDKLVMETVRPPLWRSLLRAMRVGQWVKNLLLFLPLLLAHRWTDVSSVLAAGIAFLSFSLGASSVYVLNDLLDVEADRHHPRKRKRPFASGELPLQAGFVLGPVLVVAALALALLLTPGFLLLLLLYFVITTLYSLVLKQIALVDVLVLAGLYTLRILAGSAATQVDVSEWLLAFSMFLFLSLAAVKRCGELLRLRDAGEVQVRVKGRGYFAADFELVSMMGLSSGYIAVLVFAFYVTSDQVTKLYARPAALWFICPLLLYWISRIWLLAHRGEIQDDPLTFAVRDKTTWAIALVAAVVLGASGAR